ncbi:hypothetical protein IE81DRAFT_319122 [Ceraceosorus guamensis]|uniref:Uncharacterized protein n=1 Tax=Ceraceosorus guamensis TaxID=1522189 RepID=A0A316W8T1_9BASI|nr:hypothetical protein IE81DRAFT_319122 [Ceraceosorus guamensis]PWN46242.1 hypothetical protein IE81DRAFT_319122 [Ceraceosorus guamensis]
MSHVKKDSSTSQTSTTPASIVRPGASPEGPPGWEEKRVAQVEAHQAEEAGSACVAASQSDTRQGTGSNSNADGTEEREGLAQKLKDQVHKVGEKLAFVPPKGGESKQDASTMPEVPIE